MSAVQITTKGHLDEWSLIIRIKSSDGLTVSYTVEDPGLYTMAEWLDFARGRSQEPMRKLGSIFVENDEYRLTAWEKSDYGHEDVMCEITVLGSTLGPQLETAIENAYEHGCQFASG